MSEATALQLEQKITEIITTTIKNQLEKLSKDSIEKEWLTMKEACAYAGVSFNTLTKFRHMGLKVCEIDGIRKISKSEIDRFLAEHSY